MILLERLTVRVPGFAVIDLDLEVRPGEFFVLLGPTGSGKTLILESIAGLTRVASGRVLVQGRDVTRKPPEQRRVGVVYQDSALFPHLNVEKNIAFGRRYHMQKPEQDRRLTEIVDQLGLVPLLKRSVNNLSGGEKQRVALARALAVSPSVLLLDEPLSSLDQTFREEIRKSLKDLHHSLGLTFFMVTHDFSEALFLADRAAVLSAGRVEQCGPIQEIFRQPKTPFVARFVGMKNLFPAERTDAGFRVGPFEIPGPAEGTDPDTIHGYAGVRPEDLTLLPPDDGPPGPHLWPGRILEIDARGIFCQLSLEIGGLPFSAAVGMEQVFRLGLAPGSQVLVDLPPDRWRII